MPQPEYRLRLAEGTLLVVDHDALSSWVVDDKALVRPPGSKRWRLLKQFLADERAGVIAPRYAEAPTPAAPAPAPEAPTLEASAVVAAPALSLPEPVAFEPPAQTEVFDPDEIAEPALPESDPTPWEWAAEQGAAAPVEAPAERLAERLAEPPAEQAVEEPIEEHFVEESAEAPAEEPEIEITVSRLFSVINAAPPPPPQVTPEPPPTPAPLAVEAPAEEPLNEEPLNLEITLNKQIPLVDSAPRIRRPQPPPVEPITAPELPDIDVEPVLSEDAAALHAATHAWLPEVAPAPVSAPPPAMHLSAHEVPAPRQTAPTQDFQALADDPNMFHVAEDSDAPVIRLKPLELDPTMTPPASTAHEAEEQEETHPAPTVDWGPGLQGAVLRRVAEWSEVLSMRIEQGRQAVRRHGGTRGWTFGTWRDARARANLTLRDWIGAALGMLFAWRELIAGWIAEAKRRTGRGGDRAPMGVSLGLQDVRPAAPALARHVVPLVPPPAPPVPRSVPPPGIHSLPTLRFKEEVAPDPVDGDLYDGEDIYGDGQAGPLATALVWAKRVVLLGGLAACGFFAFRTQDRWRPTAERQGHALVEAVGQRLQPPPSDAEERMRKEHEAQQQQLLEASTSEMPYLAPATLEHVVAAMTGGIDEASAPTDVFRRMYEATERGLSALSPEETTEWQAIRRTMLSGLPASDRQHIISYERVLRARVSLPYEDRTVMTLLARAAGALPPESRARLGELSSKAIAAGLARAAAAPAS